MRKNKKVNYITTPLSYSFNKTNTPMPDPIEDKVAPPTTEDNFENTKDLFHAPPEPTVEEMKIQNRSQYKKAERMVIINFYTGGSAYRTGMMDAIYAGALQAGG